MFLEKERKWTRIKDLPPKGQAGAALCWNRGEMNTREKSQLHCRS